MPSLLPDSDPGAGVQKDLKTRCGEMSELAEGARLEIACAAKSGTEGSNPSLSATLVNGDP